MSFEVKIDANTALLDRLAKLQASISIGNKAATRAAATMDSAVRHNLQTQGRAGGNPPPLSEMTKQIYAQVGEPDGSGIENHLELAYTKRGRKYVATLGIPDGKPTIVAKVQNDGATIPVTAKMRGYLSAVLGIHLKASTTHIVVPGRYFWDDAFDLASEQFKTELQDIFKA
jgi:phage gpG-like protein